MLFITDVIYTHALKIDNWATPDKFYVIFVLQHVERNSVTLQKRYFSAYFEGRGKLLYAKTSFKLRNRIFGKEEGLLCLP